MTDASDFVKVLAPDLISTGTQAMVQRAQSLGLTWELWPATVANPDMILYDGDTVAVSCVSLLGYVPLIGSRVMGLRIQSSNYVLASLTTDDEKWHPFTYQNSWHNNGTTSVGQFRKLAPNSVQITGELAGGTLTSGTVIANLPAGFRPRSNQNSAIAVSALPAAGAFSPFMRLTPGGDLQIFSAAAVIWLNNVFPLDAA